MTGCEKCADLAARLEAAMIERNEALMLAARMEGVAQNAGREKAEKQTKLTDAGKRIGEYWQQRCDRRGSKVLEARKKRINWALSHWSEEEIKWCIDGYAISDWHMGRDPRTKGEKFNCLAKHILKNESTFEWGIGKAKAAAGLRSRLEFEAWLGGLTWQQALDLIQLRWLVRSQEATIAAYEAALGDDRCRDINQARMAALRASQAAQEAELGVAA